MQRKLTSVFILLCSLAQSVKWHLWWLTLWIKLSVLPLIDASYVPFILYFCPAYPPGCLSFIVMSFPIGAGWRHLAARGFLYSQLAVRCTDCECSHFRLLQCNLNSSVLDKPPDSCPISISNLPYLKCGIKLFPPLGPHQVQCHYDRRNFLLLECTT